MSSNQDGHDPPTAYERFVAAIKSILSVPKADVEKDMKRLRGQRRKMRRKSSG